MGNNRQSSTQTTTTTLPGNQQRNVDTLLQGALDFFNTGGRSFFPGDIVADFDPLQTEGQNAVTNFAGGIGSDLVSDAINANSLLLSPDMLNPLAQPGFTAVIDDILRRTNQGLTENVLPAIRGGAVAAGQFGGTPGEIGEALATGRTAEAQRGLLGDLTLGQFGLGLNALAQGIGNAPGLFNLGMAPGQAVAGVGDIRQNQAQNEIQGEVARHEFGQNEPIAMLQLLRELTGQAGTFGGTTQTQGTTENKGSPINQVLGGALTAASLFNPASSIFAGLNPTGIGQSFLPIAQSGGLPSPFGGAGFNPFANMFPGVTGQ